MITIPNYYEILGVDMSATDAEIKQKYIELVKEWHPDKHKGKNKAIAQKKISDINKAKEVLCDKEKRAELDKNLILADAYDMNDESNDDDSDDSDDSEGSIVDLADFKRRLKELTKGMNNDSDDSDGDSCSNEYKELLKDEKRKKCDNYFEQLKENGMDSNGIAYITLEDIFTGVTKKVQVERKITHTKSQIDIALARIDQNADDKYSVVIKKMGHYINYNNNITDKCGNACISVKFIPHKLYFRKQFDLYTIIEVTFKEAQEGFTRTMKGLDGKKITINIESLDDSNVIHTIYNNGLISPNGRGNIYIGYTIVSRPKIFKIADKHSQEDYFEYQPNISSPRDVFDLYNKKIPRQGTPEATIMTRMAHTLSRKLKIKLYKRMKLISKYDSDSDFLTEADSGTVVGSDYELKQEKNVEKKQLKHIANCSDTESMSEQDSESESDSDDIFGKNKNSKY